MHDPTEGGLSTGLWELAWASGTKIEVDLNQVFVLPETVTLCQHLNLDPLGLMASGALLATASSQHSERMVAALQDEGIHASVIGHVVEGRAGVWARTSSGLAPFPSFDRDELARLFEGPESLDQDADVS
jgi:hydrogenase maturation factor